MDFESLLFWGIASCLDHGEGLQCKNEASIFVFVTLNSLLTPVIVSLVLNFDATMGSDGDKNVFLRQKRFNV